MSPNQIWMDELSLDPSKPWLQMGTRQLGGRPWLIPDNQRLDQLALKHQLLATKASSVLAETNRTNVVELETLQLIKQELVANQLASNHEELQTELVEAGLIKQTAVVPSEGLSPLNAAGRLVQEDLCLLQRSTQGWLLQAASLCFPSRWRLAEKIGLPLGAVHSPVPGYQSSLQARVDSMLDRLGDTVVWRRNWFIHADASLHQPERPLTGDPTIPESRCGPDLTVRSERQTLRKLSTPDWCLFTIRVQQAPLEEFLSDDRIEPFAEFLDQSNPTDLHHRGLSADQVVELKVAIQSWPKPQAFD